MRFEQTRNILGKLVPDYHRRVAGYYQDLADGEVTPRVRLMLEYLIDHELHRALALREFCEGLPPHALEKWLKGLEINIPEPRADMIESEARSNLDHLLCSAVRYKTNLLEYFEHLLDRCPDKKTLNLFQTLKSQEEKAMKRMIRHAQGLADL